MAQPSILTFYNEAYEWIIEWRSCNVIVLHVPKLLIQYNTIALLYETGIFFDETDISLIA